MNYGNLKGVVLEKSFIGGLSKVKYRLEDGQTITSSHSGMDVDVKVNDIINVGWDEIHQVEVIENEV
jgi:spermidine/putrescine transport system ATP-binding protein